jgi:IclR family KDG regulon transcriptional repressor
MTPLQECARPVNETAQSPRAVVDKAFTVLEAWHHRGETLGSSELARRTGLPKSTSHRLLGILEAAGLIERLSSGYQLGDRLHGFSSRFTVDYPPDLREISLPFLQDLYELTHETVHLAVLDGIDVHCVEKVYGHRRSPIRSRVDGLLPGHSTALGKVLLAYSPAETQRGRAVAAISISRPADRFNPAAVTERLRRSARAASFALAAARTEPAAA